MGNRGQKTSFSRDPFDVDVLRALQRGGQNLNERAVLPIGFESRFIQRQIGIESHRMSGQIVETAQVRSTIFIDI
jgi:hypothetical protein